MRIFQRTRERASTTPILDSIGRFFVRAFITALLIPAIICTTIAITGLPGLRITYTYRGPKEARMDIACLYLTVDGFQRVTPPPYGVNQCGLIEFFPFNPLSLIFE